MSTENDREPNTDVLGRKARGSGAQHVLAAGAALTAAEALAADQAAEVQHEANPNAEREIAAKQAGVHGMIKVASKTEANDTLHPSNEKILSELNKLTPSDVNTLNDYLEADDMKGYKDHVMKSGVLFDFFTSETGIAVLILLWAFGAGALGKGIQSMIKGGIELSKNPGPDIKSLTTRQNELEEDHEEELEEVEDRINDLRGNLAIADQRDKPTLTASLARTQTELVQIKRRQKRAIRGIKTQMKTGPRKISGGKAALVFGGGSATIVALVATIMAITGGGAQATDGSDPDKPPEPDTPAAKTEQKIEKDRADDSLSESGKAGVGHIRKITPEEEKAIKDRLKSQEDAMAIRKAEQKAREDAQKKNNADVKKKSTPKVKSRL